MPRSSVPKVFKKRKPFNNKEGRIKREEYRVQNVTNASPSCSSTPPQNQTSSKKKLQSDFCKYGEQTDPYQIFSMKLLSQAIKDSLLVKTCISPGVSIVVVDQRGLGAKMMFVCEKCDFKHSFFNSDRQSVEISSKTETLYDINIRVPYGLRAIGKGQAAGKMLFGILNLPQHAKLVAEESMSEAIEEAVEESSLDCVGENRVISAAFDGTWQKRGYQSLNGVVTATCIETGKVIDVSILTKHCKCSNKENHDDSCTANYIGSSGGMEVAGAKEIFSRSIEKYNVRYVNFLGDGDSKGYNAVVACKPYGEDVTISKLECVNHIQKRMGSRLRKLKKDL